MDAHDLAEHDVQGKTRFGRWQMHRLDVTAFQPDRGFRDSRRLHATRRFLREARELELVLAALELTAGQVHGIAQVEGRDVDDDSFVSCTLSSEWLRPPSRSRPLGQNMTVGGV